MESSAQPTATPADTDTLRKDLDTLRRDVAQIVNDLKGSSRRGLHAGSDVARAGFDHAQQQTADFGRNIAHEIEARPLASVTAAFVAGLILGRLFGR